MNSAVDGLLHISISAREPERVAAFLASVVDGRMLPFPPFPDSWIVFAADGSAIEVYPATHRLYAGDTQIDCRVGDEDVGATFVHAAIGSPLPQDTIIERGEAEGWTTRVCDRGPFFCVEVWLEDRLLVEILDPDMQATYRRTMTAEGWASMFGLKL